MSFVVKAMSSNDLLQVETIHTFIGQFHILEGVSLSVPRGSITALLGRNGAGKTTTLKSIIGLLSPREGRVLFGGQLSMAAPHMKLLRWASAMCRNIAPCSAI